MKHTHDLALLDKILARGLCQGSGDGTETFCAEQAVAVLCGLPVTDHPDECVTPEVSAYGRQMNDDFLGTDAERAALMRDFLLAQIGSKGVVDGAVFAERLILRTIQRVLPLWLRFGGIDEALIVACGKFKTLKDAEAAADAAANAASSA